MKMILTDPASQGIEWEGRGKRLDLEGKHKISGICYIFTQPQRVSLNDHNGALAMSVLQTARDLSELKGI